MSTEICDKDNPSQQMKVNSDGTINSRSYWGATAVSSTTPLPVDIKNAEIEVNVNVSDIVTVRQSTAASLLETSYQGGAWSASVSHNGAWTATVESTDLDIRDLTATDIVTANIQGYRSNDSTFQPLRLDRATNTIQTIDYAHHEIHAGNHFIYTDHNELDDTGSVDYLIQTPDTTKWAHMLFDLDGSAITEFKFFEDVDKTGSTALTIGNSNRNSSVAATVLLFKGATGTADGNLLHAHKGGSSSQISKSGSGTRNDEEIILKQNTKYILRTISGTDNNLTNIRLEWYEHIDINEL